jgi:hypothetical protein
VGVTQLGSEVVEDVSLSSDEVSRCFDDKLNRFSTLFPWVSLSKPRRRAGKVVRKPKFPFELFSF